MRELWFALACGAATAALLGTVNPIAGVIGGVWVMLLIAFLLDVLERLDS